MGIWHSQIYTTHKCLSSSFKGLILGERWFEEAKSEMHTKCAGGLEEGRRLVSMWGDLVIFDLIPLVSQCSASQIVSFAETNKTNCKQKVASNIWYLCLGRSDKECPVGSYFKNRDSSKMKWYLEGKNNICHSTVSQPNANRCSNYWTRPLFPEIKTRFDMATISFIYHG